jgi:ribulose-phosphate 3-epimerase
VRRLDRIRQQSNYGYRIEIDGGVSHANVAEIVRAGCDWLVAGSAVFHSEDAAAAVNEMQQIAAEATSIKV